MNQSHLQVLTDASFEAVVQGGEQPVLVDFWATWCPPCRALTPTIEELSEAYQGRATVAKLDVDDNPETPAKYQVSAIPTVLVFRDGREVDRITGLQGRERYAQALDEAGAGAAV